MNRLTNFFLNFLSKKWLVICFVLAVVLWVTGYAIESQIQLSRGKEVDSKFVMEWVKGFFLCQGITFGCYGVVLSFRALIAVKLYQNSLLSGEKSALEILRFFQEQTIFQKEEHVVFQSKGFLTLKDRFPFWVTTMVTGRGLYLSGGVIAMSKYLNGLPNSTYNRSNGFVFLSFDDIESVFPEVKQKLVAHVRLKNGREFKLKLAVENYKVDSFPRHLVKGY